MGYKIGQVVEYGAEVIRVTTCWRCKFNVKKKYQYGNAGRKTYCEKTKRYGNAKRACFCKKFESNSTSYIDPYAIKVLEKETE